MTKNCRVVDKLDRMLEWLTKVMLNYHVHIAKGQGKMRAKYARLAREKLN